MKKFLFLLLTLAVAPPVFGAVINVTPSDDFDAVMRGAPAGSVINLAAGTYFTIGNPDGTSKDTTNNWVVKSGWLLQGAGVTQTKIILTNANIPVIKYHVIAADGNAANNVTIQDLTIDANGSRFDQSNNRSGIVLRGSRNTLRNIKAIGWGSQSLLTECFVLGLYAHQGDAWHNTIDNCTVTEPTVKTNGTGFTGIVQSTTDTKWQTKFPVVRASWVDNVGGHTNVYGHGYTFYAANGGILETSKAYNVTTGVNWDSYGLEAAILRNNEFYKVNRGVFLNATTSRATVRELYIHDNLISLNPTTNNPATIGIEVNGFAAGRGTPLGAVVLRQNHVTIDGGVLTNSNSYLALVRGATNAVIINNLADFVRTPAIAGRYNRHVFATNNSNLAGINIPYVIETEDTIATLPDPIIAVIPPPVPPPDPPPVLPPPVLPPEVPPETPPVVVIPPPPVIGIFVATNGLASNTGTEISPIDLATALDRNSSQVIGAPARRVVLRLGTYTISSTLYPTLIGSADNPWIIEPYPGEWATLNFSTALRHGVNYNSPTTMYHQWKSVRFTDVTTTQPGTVAYQLVKVNYGTSIGFIHCQFDNCKWSGFIANGPAANTWLYGCVLRANGTSTQFDHGMYIKSLSGTFTVANSFFVNNGSHQFHGYNSSSSSTEAIRGILLSDNSIFTYGEPSDRPILLLDDAARLEVRDCLVVSNWCYNLFPGVDATDLDRSVIKVVNGINTKVENNFNWGGGITISGGTTTSATNVFSTTATWTPGAQSRAIASTHSTNIVHVTIWNPASADNVSVDLTGKLPAGTYDIRCAASPQDVCKSGTYTNGVISFPMTNLIYKAQVRTGGFAYPGTVKANGFIVTHQ